MNTSLTRRSAVLALLAAPLAAAGTGIPAARAHGYKLGSIGIGHPWSRATPKSAKVGAGYMTLVNHSTEPERLVSVASDVSGRAEIHEMATRDGVMTMRPLADGVPIPAGETVSLAPGGLHIMFLDLKAPLVQGEDFSATLTFEKAGSLEVTFRVEAIGARGGHPGHGGHGH